jgi:hypothetical protein
MAAGAGAVTLEDVGLVQQQQQQFFHINNCKQ